MFIFENAASIFISTFLLIPFCIKGQITYVDNLTEHIDLQKTALIYKDVQPDVVTLDLDMPVINGIEVAKLILKNFPKIKSHFEMDSR